MTGEVARTVIALAIGFLLGSVLPAELFARARGVDLTTVGDGNPGTINAFRGMGRAVGIVTAVYDALVGIVAIRIAALLGLPEGAAYLAGIAAVAGHRFPVFHGFRGGGQGMAASAGLLVYGVGLAVGDGWLTLWDVSAFIGIAVVGFAVTRSDRMAALVMLPLLVARVVTAQTDRQLAALIVAAAAYIWLVQLAAVRRRVPAPQAEPQAGHQARE